ncbi:MAG: hypothetical protein IJI66_10260 [Erysipelotrichaceae bacterium]|nr:hypothetical protein [Erysipelotrichaceae bacterium]
MLDKNEITLEELENVMGGTIEESASLAFSLAVRGYGIFIKPNNDPGRSDIVNIEGMQEFFATKGYKFIPGFGEEMNIFVGPDGMKYGNDYII